MGYFDGLVSGSFKQDEAGQTLFFPHGIFGGGKRAPSEGAARSLRISLKVYYMIGLPAIVAATVLSGALLSMVTAAIMIALYEIFVLTRTASWESSAARLTYAESTRNSAKALGKGWLIALLICSLLFVAAGAGMVVAAPEVRWQGLFAALFFGTCAVVFAIMLGRRGGK
jgi:hypothetical protein